MCTSCGAVPSRQDMELVEQCVRENAGDPDLAIVELLQLMDLTGDGPLVNCGM